MENKEIFELISRFENSSLSKMEMCDDNFSLKLERETVQMPTGKQTDRVESNQTSSSAGITDQPDETAKYESVKSPLVGVFYESAAPSESPYAEKGQKVKKGQVLCLVEAMKMMNELKSPTDGIIVNAYGINGELVEFGQVLFEVEPC